MAAPEPEVAIRALGPSDLGLMRGMLRMFGREFDDMPTYTAAPPDDAYLGRLLAREVIGARVIAGRHRLDSASDLGAALPDRLGQRQLARRRAQNGHICCCGVHRSFLILSSVLSVARNRAGAKSVPPAWDRQWPKPPQHPPRACRAG